MPFEDLVTKISLDFPWIGKSERRINSLHSLISEAARAHAGAGPELIKKLLSRFTFLSRDDYEDNLLVMAHFIRETFDLSKTVLCATTADRRKDSAQLVLYDLTTAMASIGKYEVRTLNRYDAAIRENAENAYEHLILVDEFVGSGKSLAGRAESIRRQFGQKSLPPPKIHALALVGMIDGLRAIYSKFDSINICIALNKGIKGFAKDQEREGEYRVMFGIEALLAPEFGNKPMPSLGFASSEALYSRHGGSCPNNVFPVFWWPHSHYGADRNPLFPRAL